MWLVVRPLLSRLGARITTRENLTQNVVALTFVLLLASAFTTEVIGIHALFGAFLFGTIMPRQGDYAQALAERLEDFVVVALLPLFFAFSGLRTELGLLDGARDWLTCLTLVAVACAGKFGGTFGVARFFGMSLRDAGAIGVLMNTRGLMELIVLNVGLDLGVISPKIFTMMVLMALITTIMTTPLLKLVAPRGLMARASSRESVGLGGLDHDRLEPREKSAHAALEQPESPDVALARFLFCVGDASIGPAMAQLAISALARVDREAAHVSDLRRSVALHLERPRDRTSRYLGSALLEERAASRAGLSSFVDALATGAVPVEALSFDSRDPALDICEVVRAKQCDYVVLGLHRPVLGQNVFGGIVGNVLADSPAPVALLIDHGLVRAFTRSTRSTRPRRVVAALCGGAQDARVLDFATRLLRDREIALSVLHVAASDGVANTQLSRASELAKLHPERVQVQAARALSGLAIVLGSAPEVDLLLLGLELHWGLSSEGLESEAARRLLNCAASLLLIHERQGST